MSNETSASETTPLRRPDSRNSEDSITNAAATRNATNVFNAKNVHNLGNATTNVNTATVDNNSSNNTIQVDRSHSNNHNNNNSNSNNNNLPATSTTTTINQSNVIKMDTNKRILCRVAIDVLILLCVGFPILIFHLWGDAYKRGFFCDDESLKHPFKDSTVQNWMLYIIGLVIPLAVIFTVELLRSKQNTRRSSSGGNSNSRRYVFMDYEIPDWLLECYKKAGVFGFGAAVSQLTTDIAKYSIGRFRPHFFAVCQPQMYDGSTCADTINAGRYIVDFTCAGIGSSARMLKEVRLSFPSGHSSFTFYTMVYVALYLQARLNWNGSKLLRHFLQFLLIMIAWYTALSRISDYKHHWSDVLAGCAIGSLTAVVVANYISDLFCDDNKTSHTLPRTVHDMPPQTIAANGH